MNQELEQIQRQEQELLLHTYARYPVCVESARGCRLFDSQGGEYLDLLAGISVCNLGHCRQELQQVLQEQAGKLVHISNLFYQRPQLELAKALLQAAGLERAFFCNSGAEANEAAIKLARRYFQVHKQKNRYRIITLEGSFHGRTLATLAATGQPGLKQGFEPLPEGFSSIPAEDLKALEQALQQDTAGLLLEVIQGEGGVRPLSREYLLEAQSLCRDRGILFMIDEVQTGMGRTGRIWAYEHYDLQPDIVTTAKALANGLPLGAMLASKEVAQGFSPGSHATTFGGGALVCKVASKVLEILQQEGLVQEASQKGEYFRQGLLKLKSEYPAQILEVRGLGLMLGVELGREPKRVWQRLLEKGFVCNLAQGQVLRLLPPLVISRQEMDSFCQALGEVLGEEHKAE
ncbi:MAG: aspartate aminotransferase family protein [Desulfohalobiaceae bacterium]